MTLSEIELDPIAIDPRPCGLCGLTIDRHEQVDTPEGPEFICIDFAPDEMTLDELNEAFEQEIMLRTADLVRQWELADPRDRWRHTGEPPPQAVEVLRAAPEPYRMPQTPEAVINAFKYVVSLGDPKHLTRWLAQHPLDAPFLLTIWKQKNAR
jgi:hypothetical protein